MKTTVKIATILALSIAGCGTTEVIEGPQGLQGIQGRPGSPGQQGDRGPRGEQGPPGTSGTNGITSFGSDPWNVCFSITGSDHETDLFIQEVRQDRANGHDRASELEFLTNDGCMFCLDFELTTETCFNGCFSCGTRVVQWVYDEI